MTRRCTIPKIFGFREWFESRFGDLCEAHDIQYVAQNISRYKADLIFSKAIWQRGYPLLAVAAFIFTRGLGWLYWHDII